MSYHGKQLAAPPLLAWPRIRCTIFLAPHGRSRIFSNASAALSSVRFGLLSPCKWDSARRGSCCHCRSRLRPGCRSILGSHGSRSCCRGCRSLLSLGPRACSLLDVAHVVHVHAGRIGLLSALSHTRSARPRLCRGGWVQIPCVAPRGHVVPTRVRRYAAAARPRTHDR